MDPALISRLYVQWAQGQTEGNCQFSPLEVIDPQPRPTEPKPGSSVPTSSARETRSRDNGASPAPLAEGHLKQALRLIKAGQLWPGEDELRRAIRLNPALADAHANLGVTLARRGRLADAEAAFRLAIRLNPTAAGTYTNLGLACLQQGKPADAESCLRQALILQPEQAEAHRLLGAALETRKQTRDAEAAYREALRFQPDLADAHFRLGKLLAKKGHGKEAEAQFREAIRLQPEVVLPYNCLGNLLEAMKQPGEAETCYREGLRRKPDDPELHNNLGVALAALDRFPEAEACYRQALRLRPRYAIAHSNLGNALRMQGRLPEAAESLGQALRLQANYAEAHNNLGIVLINQGRTAEGVLHYEEALRLRPDYPEAHLNRAIAWLGAGDFARGWPEYEWRLKGPHLKEPRFKAPRWGGGPLEGRTLFLVSEQGAGDTIQFIRYAPQLAAPGATVVADAPPELTGLLATCPGVAQVLSRGQTPPAFDAYLPLLSLPGILGTGLDSIPAQIPYLQPDPDRVVSWRNQLQDVPGLRVGIAWQGSPKHKGDRQRSVPLSRFAELAGLPGVALVSLQKGPSAEQLTEAACAGLPIRSFPLEDFADTAALVVNLDLVICVDTAVAHLAGALGVPAWMALPFAADWRWLRDREDSPWYKNMRLFRQPAPGDWEAVFIRLAAALREHGLPPREAA